jgi:hypothetical protein
MILYPLLRMSTVVITLYEEGIAYHIYLRYLLMGRHAEYATPRLLPFHPLTDLLSGQRSCGVVIGFSQLPSI